MPKPFENITLGKVLCLAALAATINVFPWFFLHPGADAFFRYALMQCFDWQFWHGDLSPGWCMHSNGGLGSPAFLFYFPLTYYVTALLHPIYFLGGNVDDIYVASLWLGGVLAFMTCWLWLSDCFDRRLAVFGAFLFLWMPYRSELLFFRAAQTELWEMAFLPLMFLALRRALRDKKPNWANLSFVIIASLFTQMPIALAGLLGAGLYMLIIVKMDYVRWLKFIAATALAMAALAFYVLPAHYFLAFLDPARLIRSKQIWVNRGFEWEDIHGRLFALIAFSIMSLLCLGLAVKSLRNRMKIGDTFLRQEAIAWCAIGVVSFILIFPVGKPFWYLLELVAGPVISPWRVQSLIAVAAVYLFCTRAKYLLGPRQQKTFNGDYAMLVMLLMLVGGLLITMPSEKAREYEQQVRDIQYTVAVEYKTPWTDEEHATTEYIYKQADIGKTRAIAEVAGKHGAIADPVITADTIRFTATLNHEADVIVKHWYFPIWHASVDGKMAEIKPQEHTGEMILHLTKGTHAVVLTHSVIETIPALYWMGCCISLSALIILAFWWRKSRVDLPTIC